MDWQIVTEVWLEPGTDFRARQKKHRERTRRYGRLPIGEKGIGRFAVHKLGTHITLITRKRNNPEVVVEIDWTDFEGDKYLSRIPVKVREREPRIFVGKKTGTRIEIARLRNDWTRGMVRELARSITSICSPFEEKGSFRPKLVLMDRKEWLEGILS